MPTESAGDRIRRIAASLRAAVDLEESFGTTDILMPPRTRPPLEPPVLAPAPSPPPPPPAPVESEPEVERPPERAAPPVDVTEIPTLEDLAETVASCRKCHLHATRNRTVPGAGRPDADLMVVGEAPGADEDRQGVPFIGKAGRLLTDMLNAIDLPRDQVFICNTLKCRPPGNRTPEPPEIAACLPYLLRQIRLIRPKIILALGTPAARTLLDTRQGITRIRGKIFPCHGARCVPSFHPAYLLRNPPAKRESWTDLQLVKRLLDEGS